MKAYYGEVTQGGILIAQSDDGAQWHRTILPFKEYKTRAYGWGKESTVIDPSRQLEEYFQELDNREVKFTRIHGTRPVGV